MSKENVTAFRKLVETDDAIQREVSAAASARAFEGIIDVANAHGFDFTAQELFGVLSNAELSIYELELVAGGVARGATEAGCERPAAPTNVEELAGNAAGQPGP